MFLKHVPHRRRRGAGISWSPRVKNDLSTHKNTEPHQREENSPSPRLPPTPTPIKKKTPVCVNRPSRTGQLVCVMSALCGLILQVVGARCSYQEPSRLRPLWGKYCKAQPVPPGALEVERGPHICTEVLFSCARINQHDSSKAAGLQTHT